MTKLSFEDKELIEKLHLETAKISWLEIQRFFAAGRVLLVDESLDLLETAVPLVKDDTVAIGQLIDKTLIEVPSDDQAKSWFDHQASMWAVVVKPWVLIQEISTN